MLYVYSYTSNNGSSASSNGGSDCPNDGEDATVYDEMPLHSRESAEFPSKKIL